MSYWNYRIGFKRHSVDVIDDVTHETTGDVVEEITYGLKKPTTMIKATCC